MVALQQREQGEKIGALLAHMRTITEANLEDAHEILQVFHDGFAKRIAEEVHTSMFHCVETVSPAPNQTTLGPLEVCDFLSPERRDTNLSRNIVSIY